MIHFVIFETPVEVVRFYLTRPPAVGKTHHTLLDQYDSILHEEYTIILYSKYIMHIPRCVSYVWRAVTYACALRSKSRAVLGLWLHRLDLQQYLAAHRMPNKPRTNRFGVARQRQ